ncbi:MAG: N-acetylglucosamine-6-phosphate deacetylase [Anaerolineaceae bacterium]
MKSILINCTLVLPEGLLPDGAVIVDEEGKIIFAGRASGMPAVTGNRIDLEGYLLSPGFIDIHVHGGKGITFGEGDLAANNAFYSNWVASNGVTGYLMSVAEATDPALLETIRGYVKVLSDPPQGAETLGIHLEGPYLNPEKKGAFNPDWLRNPDVEETAGYIAAGKGWIRQITIAPELPGAAEVARLCRQAGILVAMGHTNCTYEEAERALKADFRHVTHAFNAQRGFENRAPGVFGAVLTSNEITAELIADTIHVHPGAMKLLLRCLGSDRVIAVSDAMSATGLEDGAYRLVGHPVFVKNGKATLEDGTLAGSIVTLNRCVENLVKQVGLPLHEAVKTASLNPARAIGLGDRLGSIGVGKDASLILIDEDINVRLAMVKGRVVFQQR